MQVDVATLLTWKDGLLLGVLIGLWLNARGRRHQGERLGVVERAIVAIAKSKGIDLEEDSNPGRQRARK